MDGRVARCHPGTREELIAKIIKWSNKGGRRRLICWLNGSAGSGKSAVWQTIAECVAEKDRLIGSFFFLRGAGDRSKMAGFIRSLIYQLSLFIPATKPLIKRILESEPSIFQTAFRHQLKKLMIEPILAIRNSILTTLTTSKPKAIVAFVNCIDNNSLSMHLTNAMTKI